MDEIYLSPLLRWLLRASWQASVLVVLVCVAQWVFRKSLSAKWRHRLWLLVLLRLILPVSLPSTFSIFNYLDPSLIGHSERAPSLPDSAGTAAGSAARRSANVDSSKGGVDVAARSLKPPNQTYSSAEDLLIGLSGYSLPAKCVMFFLLIVWPLGIVLIVLRILRQNVGFTYRLRRAPVIAIPEVLHAFEDCKLLLAIDLQIRLIETKEIKSPALYGLFRPKLLLPEGMVASFSLQELRYIFLHELAHVQRLDMALNWLMAGLQILHWFNPVIWLAFARMRTDRELACDALVLSRTHEGESEYYGQTIIKLLESFVPPLQVSGGLVGILEEKEQMKRRITMIARFQKASNRSLLAGVLVLVLGLVSLTDAKIPAPMPTQPVGWWRAEGSAKDATGLNHGLPEGRVEFGAGSVGKAFHFNGVDTAVKVAASPSLDVGQGAGFTISADINPASIYNESPLIQWNSGSGGVRLLLVTNFGPASLYAEITDVRKVHHYLVSGSGLIKPGVFQHVTLTYNRSSGIGALYLNGQAVTLTFLGVFAPLTDGDLYFGLQPGGEGADTRFTGQIDEIQIFNYALSESEARQYPIGLSGKLPSLVSGSP
jgi:beta-lactamase regulating signal transducer with metallopeptidase domain